DLDERALAAVSGSCGLVSRMVEPARVEADFLEFRADAARLGQALPQALDVGRFAAAGETGRERRRSIGIAFTRRRRVRSGVEEITERKRVLLRLLPVDDPEFAAPRDKDVGRREVALVRDERARRADYTCAEGPKVVEVGGVNRSGLHQLRGGRED